MKQETISELKLRLNGMLHVTGASQHIRTVDDDTAQRIICDWAFKKLLTPEIREYFNELPVTNICIVERNRIGVTHTLTVHRTTLLNTIAALDAGDLIPTEYIHEAPTTTNEVYTEAQKEYHKAVECLVDQCGFACLGIYADGTDNQLGFYYTVGLAKRNLPEIIVSGFSELFHGLINTLAQQMFDTGVVPQGLVDLGYIYKGPAQEPCRFSVAYVNNPTSALENQLTNVERLYRALNPKVIQLFWADKNNVLPNEAGYDNTHYPQEIF